MKKELRKGILCLSVFSVIALVGCSMPTNQKTMDEEENKSIENKENIDIVETTIPEIENTSISVKEEDTITELDVTVEHYEYYLTKEELITDIEQGYIFRLDTTFKKPLAPFVSEGYWPFYVHEENIVNLAVEFSDLLVKRNKNIFPMDEQIVVEVISPDKQSVYRFEKAGEEITKNTSIQEQISVTPGEWALKISFAYVCGDTPSHLKMALAYETPSEEDINWLKEERLDKNKDI